MSGTGASRSGRATWNFASMMAFTALTVVTGLMVTPSVVRWLGDDRFGASRVIAEYAGWLTLLDLGLGGALAPLLARSLSAGGTARVRATFAAGARLYGRVALLILVVGLAFTPLVTRLVTVAPALSGELRWAWVLTILGLSSMAFLPFRALVEADQRGYVFNLVCCVQALTVAMMSVSFARMGMGLWGQALALAIGSWSSMGLLAAAALRAWPRVASGVVGPVDPEAAAALKKLSGPTLLMNVCGRISLMTDSIVVDQFLGPAVVTTLFVTQRLATLAQSQLSGVGSAAWAGLVDLHNRGDHPAFRARLIELTRLVAILGAAGLAPIFAFNDRFVALWVGPGRDGGSLIVAVASVNAFFLALFSLWGWCINGTGRAARMLVPSIIGAVVNLSASLALTATLGVVGPILGSSVSFALVYLPYYPVIMKKCFGIDPFALLGAAAVPGACGLLYALALSRVVPPSVPLGWIGLAGVMGGSFLLFLTFSAIVLIGAEDRARWRRRLAAMIPRLGPRAA